MAIEDDPRPIYAAPMDVDTYQLLGLDKHGPKAVNGCSNGDVMAAIGNDGDKPYSPCAEAYPAENVPPGEIVAFKDWQQTEVYKGTRRRVWVYLPPGGERQNLNLIIFNDGHFYLSDKGQVRAPRVLDSLHYGGDIPPTAAIFVSPGSPPEIPEADRSEAERDIADECRSIEYDSLRDDYGRFLLDELIPFVEAEVGISFTDDPARRIMCGISSGGIGAFTVAWHYPDRFAKVLSHCGSYTNIKGGHNYPWLIRSTPRKPIKVFLQSGENDCGTLFGDWPLANKTMANALEYAGYDYRFEFGTGGHTAGLSLRIQFAGCSTESSLTCIASSRGMSFSLVAS